MASWSYRSWRPFLSIRSSITILSIITIHPILARFSLLSLWSHRSCGIRCHSWWTFGSHNC